MPKRSHSMRPRSRYKTPEMQCGGPKPAACFSASALGALLAAPAATTHRAHRAGAHTTVADASHATTEAAAIAHATAIPHTTAIAHATAIAQTTAIAEAAAIAEATAISEAAAIAEPA